MTLFCNKALFDKVGATIPNTYDELLDACKKLAQLDGAESVNAMLNGDLPFSEDGYKAAAEKVVELYNAGAFGKNPLEAGNDDANSAFITEKAAMRLMGSWFANQVYTDESATVNPENVVACKIPMITGKGNETDYCGGFVESFWVNKSTAYPEEAAKFAIYINEKMGKAAYETGSGQFNCWSS